MVSILDGASTYIFYWRWEPSPQQGFATGGIGQPRALVMRFSSAAQAAVLLHRLGQSWEYRRLAASNRLIDPFRLSQDQILEALARQMAAGWLLVERRWRDIPSTRDLPPQKVVVPRKAPVPDAPPAADPSTFDPDHDALSQAETLTNAAENGAPFCEECARAAEQEGMQQFNAAVAAVTQRPPASATTTGPSSPEQPTLGGNNDAQAQAQTLQDAAQTGVPFCEECEKARQEQESEEAVAV